MRSTKIFLTICCIICLFLVNMAKAEQPSLSITVEDAWIRAMPPNLTHTAGYLSIKNTADKDISLSGVKSDLAETVELHTMETVDGIMKMRQIQEIVIPKQKWVELKPGGLHIMFIGLKSPLKEGGKVTLTLKFSNGMQRNVQAIIRRFDMTEEHMKGSHTKGSHSKGSHAKGSHGMEGMPQDQ